MRNLIYTIIVLGSAAIGGQSDAADQPNATAVAAMDAGGILAGRAPRATALTEFEQLVCPLDQGGGMLTAIVNAALAHGGAGEDFSVDVAERADDERLGGIASADAGGVTFPWYKPNCDRPSYLTEHTKRLCDEASWSEPIFEMFVGYFTRADYERPLMTTWHLMGATLCVSGQEFPNLLRERGVSENNARIIKRDRPGSCLSAVMRGDADVAVLPDSVADEAMRDMGLIDKIIRQPALDDIVTLHAVAVRDDADANATLAIIDRGLNEIRESGEWFEIVASYLSGHTHDAPHSHEAHSHNEEAHSRTALAD